MYKYFTLIVLAFLFFFSTVSRCSTTLGTYGEWEAMYWNTEEGLVCSIISAPTKQEGKYTKRGQVYAQISQNKGSEGIGIVSFQAGYTFKKNIPVIVNIDSKHTFKLLLTNNQTAWADTDTEDALLIKFMKLGTKMVVKGVSSRGTNTIDTYSLKGFIAAYKAMNKICK